MKKIKEVSVDQPFIKSRINDLQFEKMKTDLDYYQGIDPYASGTNSLYRLDIHAGLHLSLVVFQLMFLIIN